MSERRHAVGPLADYSVGMRVMTKEGFPGSIDDIHEGPADLTTYNVTLDNDMGGGMYAEAEIWPLNEVSSSKPVTSNVEVTAADDYPELGSILNDRLPPEIRQTLAHVAALHPVEAAVPLTCKDCGGTYYTDNMADPHHEDCQKVNGEILSTGTSDEARDWGDAGAHEDMEGDSYVDPPYSEDDDESAAQHEAFYLPLDNSHKDQKFDNPDEEQGWKDGTADGKAGITRNIQDPTNVAYRAGYDRGWAYGVEIYRAPAGGFDLGDFQTIEQMQTVDPPTNRLSSRQEGQADLPFFEAGQLWDLIKGTPVDPDDPVLKGHLTYDWCRYRKDGHCFYSKTLDMEASTQAGYAVWTPEDRGPCYRQAWASQETCPIALPGPHVPGGFTDATVTWEQGGQHGGVPTNVIRAASKDASISKTADEDQCPYCSGDSMPTGGGGWKCMDEGHVWNDSDPAAQAYHGDGPQRGVLQPLAKTAAQAVCPICTDTMLSAVAGMSCMKCGTLIPYCSTEGLTVLSDDGLLEDMRRRFTAHKTSAQKIGCIRCGAYKTPERDASGMWWCRECKDPLECDECGQQLAARHQHLTSEGALDPSLAFMLTATWKEVRDKAKKIRSDGHVRIIASKDGIVTAHVKGDTNVYETEVVRGHGKGVSHWTCGCKWAAYSWGRSGPWKKYEGRMCSHALALQYEAQARNMFGRSLTLDEAQPEWMDSTVPVRTPNSYDRNKGRYSSLRPVTGQKDDDSPLWKTAYQTKSFPAKVWGRIVRLIIMNNRVYDVATDEQVAVKDVLFPGYDPVAGLRYVDPAGVHEGSLRKTANPIDMLPRAKDLSQAADLLLEAAHDVEPSLTPLLTHIAASEGGQMAGLDHRFKDKPSLLRKMTAEASLYPSPGDCAKNMSDPLRYTMVLPTDEYSITSKEVLDTLTSKGYRKRVKNFWVRGDDYNGINVALTSPEGVPVEVQFHTKDSLSAKKACHPLYEQWRTSSDPKTRSALTAQMTQIADSSLFPPGVHLLQPFKRKSAAVMTLERVPRFLLIHDVEDAPLAVLRVDTDGDVARWEGGGWVEALEYGRFAYLGEPRSHEIDEDEAGHYCDWLTLHDYDLAYAAHTEPKEAAMSAEEWGILSDLHDVPEPALPATDGGDDEGGQTWSGYAGDPEPDSHHGSVTIGGYVGGNGIGRTYKETTAAADTTTDWLMGIDDSGADEAAMAVAAALAGGAGQPELTASPEDLQAMATANIMAGGNPGDRDIMTAAQAGLDKASVKNYSLSERQQIISEGDTGEEAGNLDRLDLSGTHYEALEARRSATSSLSESEDLGWDVMGDPNGDL